MALRKFLKKTFFSPFKLNKWLYADNLKKDSQTVLGLFQTLFQRKKVLFKQSFDDYIRNHQLTETRIKKLMQQALILLFFELIFAAGLLIYSIYLFFHHQTLSALVSITLALLLLTYAFREHFHYFQMKQRRLGCTFIEWYRFTFTRKKHK